MRRTAQPPEAKPLLVSNELLNAMRAVTARCLQHDFARMPVGRANELMHDSGARAFPCFGRLYPLQVPPGDTVAVTDAMNFQIDAQSLRQLNATAKLGNPQFGSGPLVALAHLHRHSFALQARPRPLAL